MKHSGDIIKLIATSLLAIIISLPGNAQGGNGERIFEQRFFFKFDSSEFDPSYKENDRALKALDGVLKETALEEIDAIDIISVSSPDGPYKYNVRLSEQRCESAKAFFLSRYPELSAKMTFRSKGEAWDELREMVINDSTLTEESRQKVLDVIDADDCSIETKKWRMEQLPSYNHIRSTYYPMLRSSLGCLIRYRNEETEDSKEPTAQSSSVEAYPTVADSTAMMDASVNPSAETETVETFPETSTRTKHECPPFAIKTNVLFDVAGAFNGEIEIPLGPRLSVDAEWMAPWWLSKKNMWCYEMLSMTVEGRYWLGDRSRRHMLQGWFTSVYFDTGRYDFQNKEDGIQGVFWNAGAGGGYSWNIGKSWGLEAMAGVGYLRTGYEKYVPKEEYSVLAYRQTLNTTWIGPTRLKLSIFYKFGQKMYNRKYRGVNE